MGRRGRGTRPPASPRADPAASGVGQCGGVQPRRQDLADRVAGPHAATLGCGDRDTPRQAPRSNPAMSIRRRSAPTARPSSPATTSARRSCGTQRPDPLGRPFPHSGAVSAAAFSPDGRTLLTGCEDGMARLWDPKTRTLLVPPSAIKPGSFRWRSALMARQS